MTVILPFFALLSLVLLAPTTMAADPWADRVVEYTPGTGIPQVFGSDPPLFYDLDTASLGEPARTSGGAVVSPYSSPFAREDIVSIGEGGSLTVAFDEPVEDAPGNPFGIDLLVFGNAFYTLSGGWPFADDATVTGASIEGGVVELSDDGVSWVEVTGLDADGLYPTNGYADASGFFPAAPGGVLSDFTLPVDPSYNPIGDTSAEVYAAYAGSGGGAGIDVGAYGLDSVSYVRVTNPIGSGAVPEIDAFADVRSVPEPTALALLAIGSLAAIRRGQR
ncbi:hypothetical protein MalM25_33690 [Planctomycetes bacterium MalM25]|nr:hypothetical protein MalM25_33690 [Planctomycetes bacterium MalM25]